jgi:hypothetical protein
MVMNRYSLPARTLMMCHAHSHNGRAAARLRQKAAELEKSRIIAVRKHIAGWKPSEGHAAVVESLADSTINAIDYIRVMYEPPLSDTRKMSAYRAVAELMDRSRSDQENKYYDSIAVYLGLD